MPLEALDASVEIASQPKAPVEDQSPTMSPLESAEEVIKQPLLVQPPEESSTASTFRQFIPVPKCQRTKRSTRTVAHAKVTTTSPYMSYDVLGHPAAVATCGCMPRLPRKFPCMTTDTRAAAHNKFQYAHL